MPPSPLDLLTPGVRRAAELYAAGHSYEEIANRLSLKVNTIKKHLAAARETFACRNQTAFRAAFERLRQEEEGRRLHDFSGEWLFRVLWGDSRSAAYRDIYAYLRLRRVSPHSAYYSSTTGLVITHDIQVNSHSVDRDLCGTDKKASSALQVLFGAQYGVRAIAASLFDTHHLTLEWFDDAGVVCAAALLKLERNRQEMQGAVGGFILGDTTFILADPINIVAVSRERFNTVAHLYGASEVDSRRAYIAEHFPGADVDNGALHHFLLFIIARGSFAGD